MENEEGGKAMIAFDFEYYEVDTVEDAWKLYKEAQKMDKKVMYYNGGTEFITFARKGKIYAEVIINIKNIAECNLLEVQGNQLIIGSALTLNKIVQSGYYPLLGDVLKGIADHTSRNKITIGGNLNSQLIYKEAILPLLLVDAKITTYGEEGMQTVPIRDVFKTELALKQGDLVVTISVDTKDLYLPYYFIKRTKMSNIGYPVVSAAAIRKNKNIQVAFSGVCASPFRSVEIEAIINDSHLSFQSRIERALKEIPGELIEDVNGSAVYREFLMKQMIEDLYNRLEMVE